MDAGMITLNEHVTIDTESSAYTDHFYPEDGYALYRDNDPSNIDPDTGEIVCYWKHLACKKINTETYAPHVFAKLIDETMRVYGAAVHTTKA